MTGVSVLEIKKVEDPIVTAERIKAQNQEPPKGRRYHLPDQERLVLSDQSIKAARESVVLVAKADKEERDRDAVRVRILDMIWKQGDVEASLKIAARKCLETNDFHTALILLENAQKKLDKNRSKLEPPPKPEPRQTSSLWGTAVPKVRYTWAGLRAMRLKRPEQPKAEVEPAPEKVEVTEKELTEEEKVQIENQEREMRVQRLQGSLPNDSKRELKSAFLGEKVSLECKKLTEVPDLVLEKREEVKYLNLRINEIMEIPEKFCTALLGLQEADLSFNRLEFLPPTIGNLRNLKRLSVASNRLLGLPSSIGCLSELLLLNLDKNSLKKLPATLSRLSALTKMSVKGNPEFHTPPQQVLEQGLQATRGYLEQVLEEGKQAREKLWVQLDKRKLTIPILFLALDEKKEGKLDRATFTENLKWHLNFKISFKEVYSLWKLMDEDGDGFVTNREFIYQMKKPTLVDPDIQVEMDTSILEMEAALNK